MAVWPLCVGAVLTGALASGVTSAEDGARGPQGGPAEGSASPAVGEERVTKALEPSPAQPSDSKPIGESVDAAVDRFIREHTPCGSASEGVPCFPIAVERQAPEYSVEDSLGDLQGDGPPALTTAPTPGEIIQAGANPRPASGGVGFDLPCKTKQLVKKILGKGKTYYVYRVWDSTGVRGVLREEPLDPAGFAGAPEFRYELVGEFGDECEAMKAYRKVGHDARMPAAAPPAQRLELPSQP